MDFFSEFRNRVEELFEGRLSIRLITEESDTHNYPNSILLAGEPVEKPEHVSNGAEETNQPKIEIKTIIGKHLELKSFFNKDEPPYSEEFMLDLEFDYGTETCTIHHINLPYCLRDRGAGSQIIKEIENLCHVMGMKNIYVPSEHNATNFWLKHGYQFNFDHEKRFFDRNRQKKNIFIAYDLRKGFGF